MWFDGSLAIFSAWITYFLQVVFGYLTTLCICAFIRDARTRVRMWSGFLLLTTAAWIFLWVPAQAGGPTHFAFRSELRPPMAALHLAIPVQDVWASYFGRLARTAAYIYAFLLLVSVLHLLLRSLQLKGVLRRTQPPSPQLLVRFRRLCLQLNVGRCQLGLASELRSPATCYWWRSHVLLPTELVPYLDSDQLDEVLRHELVHVRQHDYLWDRLVALGCRLVLFHPLVWLAYRHLRWERELACDYAVVRARTDARLRYAECLTKLARWCMEGGNLFAGISFFSSKSLLAVRVRALLSEPPIDSLRREATRAGFVSIVASGALLLASGLGLSLYSPTHLNRSSYLPRHARSDSARKKTAGAKLAHSSMPKAPAGETPLIAPQPPPPQSINLVLDFPAASLPLLNSSTTAEDIVEISPRHVIDDVGPKSSHGVWNEAPMPLATPPQWSTLVVGAITGGAGLAAGRIDVDDVDASRKRTH
jgi:beta-lactamase regulating signal transducer with metallopeptidase domain